MSGKNKNVKKDLWKYLPWFLAVLSYLLFSVTDILYIDIDNYCVAEVVNGLYSDNTQCRYVHPLLCFVLGGAAKVFSFADVFTSFAHLMMIIGFGIFLKICFNEFKSVAGRIMTVPVLLYLQFGLLIWSTNYTVWAAFLCFVGLLLIFVAGKDEGRKRYVLAAVFYGAGFMLRWQAACLFVPFLLLEAAALFIRSDKEKRSKAFVRLIPLVVLMALLIVSRAVFYSQEPYASAAAYDEARIKTTDFPLAPWEEIKDKAEAAGVSESEYNVVQEWILSDTEVIDTEKYRAIADAGSCLLFPVSLTGLLGCLIEMGTQLCSNIPGLMLPLFAIVLMTLAACIYSKNKTDRVVAILNLLGGAVIIIYFEMLGRCPGRVWQSVGFAVFAVLLLILIRNKREGSKAAAALSILAIVIPALPLLLALPTLLSFHKPLTPFTARLDSKEESYSALFDADEVFVTGGFLVEAGGYVQGWELVQRPYMERGKLPEKEFFRHFIPGGFWLFAQPFYTELLKTEGLDNPTKALYEQERVRLVYYGDRDVYFYNLVRYLYEHYGDLHMSKQGKLGEGQIIQFTAIGAN